MYKVSAYLNGRLITSEDCPPTITTENKAKERIINTIYWNFATCQEASEPQWWKKYEYEVIELKTFNL